MEDFNALTTDERAAYLRRAMENIKATNAQLNDAVAERDERMHKAG